MALLVNDIRALLMRRALFVTAALTLACCGAGSARGQNDWQFPDPHFGVAEFGRGRPGPRTEQEYREAIAPEGQFSAPGLRRRQAQPPSYRPRLNRPRARRR